MREAIGPTRGAQVEIFAPGRASRAKTYNARLGILGGISIIGTTGIVTPMSEESWKRSLSLELEIKRAAGLERVVLVPGNHGERFVREQMGIDPQMVVTMSNFVGYMIEEAVRLGFRQIVLIGHPGKLIKIAAGIFHTHSHIADARMETLVAHLALLGAPLPLLTLVSECDTTEAAMEHIDAGDTSASITIWLSESASVFLRCCASLSNRPPATRFCFLLITGTGQQPSAGGDCPGADMLTVVGMGPAGLQWLIPAAREAIAAAEALVGGSRHLQQFPDFAGERFALGADMPALLAWIEARTGRRVVVLASGDPLFYGIGTRLIAHFGRERVQVIPGISAVQYLCARAGIDMNDMWLTSSHGRAVSFDALAAHRKVAMVTDGRCGPREIAAQLMARGKGHRWMVIGENPAMENERIHWLPVSAVEDEYEMNAVVILDER